jgi:hypothetical protein
VALWTQRAVFSWRPNLNFFERRYDVVRELESKALLRRFQERPESMAVRLQGPHQLVIFGADKLFIGVYKPDLEPDVMTSAVEVICQALAPEPQGYPNFRFQWLRAWDKDYDEARRLSADAYFGSEHPAQLVDFALVVDAKLNHPLDDCHIEMGVVDATETPRRLARGLPSIEAPEDSPRGLWPTEELPQVATLCDATADAWSLVEADGIVASIFATLERARDAADRLASSMLKPLEDLAK